MSSEVLKRDQNFITVLGGITDDADQEIRMLRVDPISKRLLIKGTISGGSGVNVETPVGIVNSSNTSYTVSNEPKFVVADASTYFSGAGYTYLAGTITMDNPPSVFIRSIY